MVLPCELTWRSLSIWQMRKFNFQLTLLKDQKSAKYNNSKYFYFNLRLFSFISECDISRSIVSWVQKQLMFRLFCLSQKEGSRIVIYSKNRKLQISLLLCHQVIMWLVSLSCPIWWQGSRPLKYAWLTYQVGDSLNQIIISSSFTIYLRHIYKAHEIYPGISQKLLSYSKDNEEDYRKCSTSPTMGNKGWSSQYWTGWAVQEICQSFHLKSGRCL